MKSCPHCHSEFDKHPTYANHVRWCKSNPKYKETLASTRLKLTATALSDAEGKHGPLTIYEVTCHKCSIPFSVEERRKLHPVKNRYYCSATCRNTRVFTDESREKISASLEKWNVENGHVQHCVDCNAVVKAVKRCSACHRSRYEKMKVQTRAKRTALENYRLDCDFKFGLRDHPGKFNIELIEEHGWYSPSNSKSPNLNGVSRDHIVSVKFGFDNGIPADVISHPANCQLLRHSDNASKHSKSSLTVEQLYEKIELWDKS